MTTTLSPAIAPRHRNSSPENPARIFVVGDHPFIRAGLKQFLESEPGLVICGEFNRARGLAEAVNQSRADAVVMDLSLPDGNGLEAIKDLRAAGFKGKILVLTIHDESIYAQRVIRAGANGYITKDQDPEELLRAIQLVLEGEVYLDENFKSRLLNQLSGGSRAAAGMERLSDREVQVLELLGSGLRTRDIGERLGISPKTVDAHRANIKDKLGIRDMNELIRFAVMHFKGGDPGPDS